jgi:hypothetical protein
MDPPPEHEIIRGLADDEDRVLDRLRRNDPTLKKLTLVNARYEHTIFQIFDAIATNSSLKVLALYSNAFLHRGVLTHRLKRTLITNTSVKHLHLHLFSNTVPGWVTEVVDIVRASQNLEALTLNTDVRLSIANIADMVQGLCFCVRMNLPMNLHSLTIERFQMNSDRAAAFAAAFQANQTIKILIMRCNAIKKDAGVSFVEALPHDHNLETIIFDRNSFDDDHALSIVRTLCHKHLKNLSLLINHRISQDGYERIIQLLKENEHSFIKLDLFQDSKDSPWHKKIRLEIDVLTWENRLQVEKDTWVDRFLEPDACTKELLFLALERAKKLDNERSSKAPNMLFYLIKESPDLIAQAIRDGH